jgi:hypothetical protein
MITVASLSFSEVVVTVTPVSVLVTHRTSPFNIDDFGMLRGAVENCTIRIDMIPQDLREEHESRVNKSQEDQ